VRAQFIALVPVTMAGACHKHERQGYGSRDYNEPVLHGSLIVAQPRASCALINSLHRPSVPALLPYIGVRRPAGAGGVAVLAHDALVPARRGHGRDGTDGARAPSAAAPADRRPVI